MVAGLPYESADPGSVGPYRILHRLGEGGMGVVYLALDQAGRAVALKLLGAAAGVDPQARRRLAREVETLLLVRHPNVAAVLDAELSGDRPYIVTAFVPGQTLEQYVEARGALPAEQVARVGRTLAGALRAIHAVGVIHRDLKPANVMMMDGEPVVIDFGIARLVDDTRLTVTGLVMGTPGYLSPEVVDGHPVTPATDWWGWGVLLAYAATGRPPFGAGSTAAVLDRVRRGACDLAGVDARLASVLGAALVVDPGRRPPVEVLLPGLDVLANAPTTGRPAAGGPAVRGPAAGGPAAGGPAAGGPAGGPVGAGEAVRPLPLHAAGFGRPLFGAAGSPPTPTSSPQSPVPHSPVPQSPVPQSPVPPAPAPAAAAPFGLREARTEVHPQVPPRFHSASSPDARTVPQLPAYPAPDRPTWSPDARTVPHLPAHPAPDRAVPRTRLDAAGPPADRLPEPAPWPAHAPGQASGPGSGVVPDHGVAPNPGVGPDQVIGPDQGIGPDQVAPPAPEPGLVGGTLLLGLATLMGLAAVTPGLAVLVSLLWLVAARATDASVTGLLRRRYQRGPRPGDVAATVAALPWRVLVALGITVLAALIPLLLAGSTAFLVAAAANPGAPRPSAAAPLAAGMATGWLAAWWGPGGSSVRRGSRIATRGLVARRPLHLAIGIALGFVLVACLVVASSGVAPDWGGLRPGPSTGPFGWLTRR